MDTDIAIGLAGAADLDAVVALALAFRDHQRQSLPSAADFRAAFAHLLVDADSEIVIARDAAGRPVGYVMSRFRYSAWVPGPSAELEDVFVCEAARGQGVGRRLVDAAITRAAARGCRLVSLTTNERNLPALTLYRTLGFSAERARWSGGRALWLERWSNGA